MESKLPAYLTEEKLIIFLYKYIDKDGIHNKQFMKYKFRPDFVSHKHKLVVEFDGYLHYTKSKTILDDYRKDDIIAKEGYSITRIPYFVQLDKAVIQNNFNKFITDPFDYIQYPHGFIDDKAVLPADFCTLGIKKFKDDLSKFSYIKGEIIKSLNLSDKQINEVYPLEWDLV